MLCVGSKDGGACYEELIPMTPRALVKMLVPPIVASLYRRIRGPIWDGIYTSFRDVPSVGAGFNSDDYAIPTLNDTRRAIQIASNYRCVPAELVEEDALLPLVASLVRRNTENVLRILDFGGGQALVSSILKVVLWAIWSWTTTLLNSSGHAEWARSFSRMIMAFIFI